MALLPGLVAVLRIVPVGDKVALGVMVWRVLSASLTPAGSLVEEMLEESLRGGHPRWTRAVWGLLLAIPSSLVVAPAKDSVLFIGARSSPRQGKLPRRWQCVCTFQRL